MVIDLSVPDVDESLFNLNADWKKFYGDVFEEDPHQMTEPLRKPLYVGCFVDVENVGNIITRRLDSRIFLFVNTALIKSLSKHQTTVESRKFGLELAALRIARDMITEIIIKLKNLGFPWPVQ